MNNSEIIIKVRAALCNYIYNYHSKYESKLSFYFFKWRLFDKWIQERDINRIQLSSDLDIFKANYIFALIERLQKKKWHDKLIN